MFRRRKHAHAETAPIRTEVGLTIEEALLLFALAEQGAIALDPEGLPTARRAHWQELLAVIRQRAVAAIEREKGKPGWDARMERWQQLMKTEEAEVRAVIEAWQRRN